jgi:UDP-N-acetylglucosamine 1-carboxyvinyltransferase
MGRLVIAGGRRLAGEIVIEGAKNAALPACVATLLTDDSVKLHHIPALRDVFTILATISSLGKRVSHTGTEVEVDPGGALSGEAEARYVEQMRASFLILGPLVARLGYAMIPLPGGCTIGRRPVDYHLRGLEQLGARVEQRSECVILRAERLSGTRLKLPYPSVGATEQLVMTATLAKGETVIENPAREPEIDDLIGLLRKMGAEIICESDRIRIFGVHGLHGAEHTIIPDRIEAGTWLIAGAMTGGEIEVRGIIPEHMKALSLILKEAGLSPSLQGESIVLAGARPRAVTVTTSPYPGFPTDLQAPLVSFLSLGTGKGIVSEGVFENRFGYVPALNRMGAKITVDGRTATVTGVPGLHAADVEAPDIRAGAALVLAGLAAQGETSVSFVERIDRGYTRIEEKLCALGAQVAREE